MTIETIWSDYQAALKRFLHTKIASEADVEDLLQDILIKTYNNLHTLKEQSSTKAWLFQIANHTVIDYYRKKGRNREIDGEAIWSATGEKEIKQQLSPCLVPFINALPEEQADLLMAIDIQNQSQKAYAEQLGISYSTLKSRVQKSRQQLKTVFDQCCHFEVDQKGNLYDFERKPSGFNPCG